VGTPLPLATGFVVGGGGGGGGGGRRLGVSVLVVCVW
jgi:hypothetical protein